MDARPPFSLASVIGSHGWVELEPFGKAPGNGALLRVERLASEAVVELRIEPDGEGVRIQVNEPLTLAEREEVAQKVRWMLGLDLDFAEFYQLARREPKLAGMEERAQGRLLRSPTLFEDTVKTILTTNTAWSGTIRMARALVGLLGTPLLVDPQRHAFPSAGQIAASDEQTLRAEAGLGYRAPYVLELAQAVASGQLDLEALKTSELPTAELRKRLLAIRGVGDYAAAHMLAFLGRYDLVPVDSWAVKMVSEEWHSGEPIGRAEVEKAFERWGSWKALAYWFWDWSYTG